MLAFLFYVEEQFDFVVFCIILKWFPLYIEKHQHIRWWNKVILCSYLFFLRFIQKNGWRENKETKIEHSLMFNWIGKEEFRVCDMLKSKVVNSGALAWNKAEANLYGKSLNAAEHYSGHYRVNGG